MTLLTWCLTLVVSLASANPFIEKKTHSDSAQPYPGVQNYLLVFENTLHRQQLSLSGKEARVFLRQQNDATWKQATTKLRWLKNKDVKRFWILNAVSLPLTQQEKTEVLQLPGLKGIYHSDYRIQWTPPRDEHSHRSQAQYTYGTKKLGLPDVHENHPHLNGKGVRVGILDTGIVPSHPDLEGKVSLYKNFSPSLSPDPADEFDHGTHVAGTIVGENRSGQVIGLAPGATLIVGRIFDHNASSTRQQILEAMQWVADPDGNPQTDDHAHIVNNSWGDSSTYQDRRPENEPFCMIVDSWVQLGIVPVFAAGNGGPSKGTINLPAGCPNAISVGATEQNDRSPHFSGTGPAQWKDLDLLKPEIVAPGFEVYSASSRRRYQTMSGTSMAAPHVSGALALLRQQKPEASVAELKEALLKGSKDLGEEGHDHVFGAGRVQLIESLQLLN